jgi:UDP-N-acetylmuramate--alanine ligase
MRKSILKLMTDINKISSIYFAGIGGIGMSALARYFNEHGVQVSGYDKTETPLTDKLLQEGMKIHFTDEVALIDKNADAVVYTPAIPSTHTELNFYKENNYPLLKRSDVLGLLTKDTFNICVAGTHGKTTTSAMIAHILKDSGYGCNAFLGGIAANYDTNFWSAPANTTAGHKKVSVAEADEYDRSFLKLSPDVAIITAMDADHLDIYGTEKNMQDAFIEFMEKIKQGGCLIVKHGLSRAGDFKVKDICTYSAENKDANIHIENLHIENGSYHFSVINNYWILNDVELNMGGMHNIENVIAAIGAAKYLKIDDEKIKAAVASFKGVKRRFEYVLRSPSPRVKVGDGLVFIDDYAHHPEELRALITGAKQLFPGKKCTIIFQPHLFSRTKDLADGFAEVLSMADETILLPIYPARELPIDGVTSELILNKMTNANKSIKVKTALTEWIKNNEQELLITAGAGDIDTLVEPIKNILENKTENAVASI